MNAKSKIKEEYIYGAIILIVAASVFPFFFKRLLPNLKLYAAVVGEVRDKKKQLQIRKETISQITKLKQEITEIDEEYKNFTQKIILQPGTFEAVKVITDIAKGIKIEFLSLKPLPLERLELASREDEGFSLFFQKEGKDFFLWEIPIAIKIKSSYINFLDFIKKIEDDQRFLKIKNIQLKKDPSTALAHNIEVTISMFSLPIEAGILKKNE